MPRTETDTAPAASVAALERAFSLLRVFEGGQAALTLDEFARATGLYKSTILRLLGTLEQQQVIVRQPNKTYALGPFAARLGQLYNAAFDLQSIVVPHLYDLVEATGESASFYTREGSMRVCRYRVDSRHTVREHVRIGDLLPLNVGAAGLVILRHTDPASADTPAEIITTLGQRDPEIGGVAAPIFSTNQSFVGALAVSGTIGRLTPERLLLIQQAVLAAARRLTRVLGGDPAVLTVRPTGT